MSESTSPILRHYCVNLIEWNNWEIYLNAESEEDAAEKAQAIMCEEGDIAFKHRDSGFDGGFAEDVGPAEMEAVNV